MAPAMPGRVRIGRAETANCQYSLEKKHGSKPISRQGVLKKLYRSLVSWLGRGLRTLMRCLQNDLPFLPFYEIMSN